MLLLYIVSFKEFGSLVCLWHDVKLRKTQLEVRSLTATWSRDLWGQRVVVFFRNVSNCWLNSYGKFGGATRRRFYAICEKPYGGVEINPPPAGARVKSSSPTHMMLGRKDRRFTRAIVSIADVAAPPVGNT